MSGVAEEVETIEVRLTRTQVGDVIFQALRDTGADLETYHARWAINFAIDRLDELGLIVR